MLALVEEKKADGTISQTLAHVMNVSVQEGSAVLSLFRPDGVDQNGATVHSVDKRVKTDISAPHAHFALNYAREKGLVPVFQANANNGTTWNGKVGFLKSPYLQKNEHGDVELSEFTIHETEEHGFDPHELAHRTTDYSYKESLMYLATNGAGETLRVENWNEVEADYKHVIGVKTLEGNVRSRSGLSRSTKDSFNDMLERRFKLEELSQFTVELQPVFEKDESGKNIQVNKQFEVRTAWKTRPDDAPVIVAKSALLDNMERRHLLEQCRSNPTASLENGM